MHETLSNCWNNLNEEFPFKLYKYIGMKRCVSELYMHIGLKRRASKLYRHIGLKGCYFIYKYQFDIERN